MLLIYSPQITNRLRYAVKLVFTNCVQAEYKLVDSIEEFNSHNGPKLSYGKQAVGNEPFVYAEGMLSETGFRTEQPAKGADYKGISTIFSTDTNSILPFDVFAAAFYIASRYEEYLPHERDNHDRYIPTESIHHKYGFLNKPVVNIWSAELATLLQALYADFTWEKPKFTFTSTIDIDNAFAFAHKGLLRGVAGLAGDVLDLKFKRIPKRFLSWMHDANDPYNTFHIIEDLAAKYKHRLKFFVLVADYGHNDKNPDWENRGFQQLIKRLADKYAIGVHPSYASYLHIDKVGEERDRVAQIIGRHVDTARCHFLRLKFPTTYRTQLYFNIYDDYTMAHSPLPGFRAGMCTPFKWFDIERDTETGLNLHPSTVMEGTLRDYMKLSPQQATATIAQLMQEVKAVGGEFISIWHNDSFTLENTEWVEVYEEMIKLAVE
ncbi:MAG: polysaccharide deacetylase family protein [Sphingobacteriales bacterium JAD_PAG50586_3]|nr:MAG: polysaccharide deacetylase family protein [Sphingobacteriales bacterium JAD_PAG50586_3]